MSERPSDSAYPRGIVPPYVFEQMQWHAKLKDIAAGLAALAAKRASEEERIDHTSEGELNNEKEQGENNG